MGLKLKIEDTTWRAELKAQKMALMVKTRLLAEHIGKEIVNYARSKPGAKKADGRLEHPGHWADVTGHLANSIQSHVAEDGLKVTTVVQATMEYAAELDAKTGYSVLGGAEKIARDAIRKYAPEIIRS